MEMLSSIYQTAESDMPKQVSKALMFRQITTDVFLKVILGDLDRSNKIVNIIERGCSSLVSGPHFPSSLCYHRRPGAVIAFINDKFVMYERCATLLVSRAGALVWMKLDGAQSISEIADRVNNSEQSRGERISTLAEITNAISMFIKFNYILTPSQSIGLDEDWFLVPDRNI
jgi:hypothetical protein